MSDFNKILTPGNIDEGTVNTVIEIPEGSILKIEYNRETTLFDLDRVEPGVFPKPVNYGFIPATLDEDGDGLDTLVVCSEPIPMGVHLTGKIVGVLNFEDDGEMDHKIICVPADDRDSGDRITSLEDLGKRWQQKIEFHFNHYKDLKKPGTTKVQGWGDVEEAKKIVHECVERYQKQLSK